MKQIKNLYEIADHNYDKFLETKINDYLKAAIRGFELVRLLYSIYFAEKNGVVVEWADIKYDNMAALSLKELKKY